MVPVTQEGQKRMASMHVTLYLYGLELDPDVIKAATGLLPARAGKRGDILNSPTSDSIGVRKMGYCTFSSDCASNDFTAHFSSLREKISNFPKPVLALPGVESAMLDIYVDQIWDSTAIDFSVEEIKCLAEMGVSVNCTACVEND
ncbi:DUF4279 domain-containing protein [Hyphomicrobium sp. D-2]|uniref:DUF4279 domain-containing protein n=1 Tax=Hyphomicrobium sp. D-2 TaxID=3041621 RepID=UPI0024586906|nr:DUF4279 domain-containing protein [Hyphomicrobium sp. D-2]MDH4982591.1 hypothetical protein [Hyphomicrobium sp. D-2]